MNTRVIRYFPDEMNGHGMDTGAARFSAIFPTPVEPESLSVPSNERFGLDNQKRFSKIGNSL